MIVENIYICALPLQLTTKP